jgi:hypothetical protein
MRETRPSGSVEGVVSNHDPYSDCPGLGRRIGFSSPKRRIRCASLYLSIDGRGKLVTIRAECWTYTLASGKAKH